MFLCSEMTSGVLSPHLSFCLNNGEGVTVNTKRKVLTRSQPFLKGTDIISISRCLCAQRREQYSSGNMVYNHCIQANRLGTASHRTQSLWQDSGLKRAEKKRKCHSSSNFQSAWQGTSKLQKSLEEIPRKSFPFPRRDISVKRFRTMISEWRHGLHILEAALTGNCNLCRE